VDYTPIRKRASAVPAPMSFPFASGTGTPGAPFATDTPVTVGRSQGRLLLYRYPLTLRSA